MSPGQPLVLIVEDEPLIPELAGLAITDAGFEVVEAANAQQALDILAIAAMSASCARTSICLAP